jgi:4-diphosphocytidyl-2-C-methyl-D-erythritol kinase
MGLWSVNKIKLSCPAKLNLNLSVLSKKINGMHEINTQFQLIDLFDEMIIEKTTSKYINVQTDIGPSIDGKKNIVYKAIKELSDYIGEEIYCDISIKKNIPLGGGLGGGSSNAAGALIGINFLFELGLSSGDLKKIGKKLGADVPFFIFGKNAHASGEGEVLIEDQNLSKKRYLLLFPQIHSSTKKLFSQWDELDKGSQERILENEENSFLPLFLQNNQNVKKIFNELTKLSSLRLSGTGSTMFYAYEDRCEIEKTLKKIPSKWRHSFCEPLQCSPLLTYLK